MNILYARMRRSLGKTWMIPMLLTLMVAIFPSGAQAQCPAIDKVTVSGCYYTNGQSLATVSVQISWGSVNAGTGNITVTLFRGATVVGTRTITPGPITVAYTGTISGAQTIVSPQVVAFDVPANGAALTLSVARQGCSTITNTQPIAAPTGCAPTPCANNALGGTVYYDFDANGQRASSETVGVAGVTITAYPKAGAPITTTTDSFGQFSLVIPVAAYPVRLEYTQIPQFLSGGRSGPNGSGSRTTVQFLNAPTCQANLGVLNQNEFCNATPLIITPCYVHGDPLVPGTAGNDPAVVGLPYNSTGRAPAKTFMLPASSFGATWAMAYNKTTKKLYTSAVVRRHAGLGPLGLGGIYQIDLTNPSAPISTNFLDVVNDLGINVGLLPTNAARGLVGDKAAKSNDPASLSAVGKIGIGGMDFSDDNTKLYFVNIFDNKVYEIDMTDYNLGGPKPTVANVKSYVIPDPGCVGGTRRSWALKAYRGMVYAGVVCDGSTSSKSNMVSYVYQLDPTTGNWKQIFSIPMTYPKGFAWYADYTGWYVWNDDMTKFPQPAAGNIPYPQPMLQDIEFDVDGSMVLAFGDRTGMQFSAEQYGPTGTALYTTVSGGDMLRAFNSSGTFILENNAKAGPATGYKPNNNQGPGFGEFYNDDLTMATDPNYLGHAENALGGLALKPGSGEVVATIMDPINLPNAQTAGDYVWANGARRLNNSTGGVNDAFIVYQRYVNGTLTNPGTAGKATGLGDIELACAQAQYIELGNRLWKDANRNGVQDADEQPLAGLQMQLYKGPTLVASTTTNAAGEYYFSTLLGHNLQPNTTYNILFGAGQFDNTTQELTIGGNKYKLTTPDAGQGSQPDQNDSDADPNVLSTALGARPGGIPQIVVTTGDYGFVDHSFDAGVYCSDLAASVTAVAATCTGSTNNDDGEVQILSINNATHYAVSVGSSFTGVSFTAATPMSSLPLTVINNAPNTGQVYTVRFFSGSDDCVLDIIVNVPQSCTINSCTAVGGAVTYAGQGALCASSNIGSLSLTGSAGNVVRWQTSTNGGTAWTDFPNTNGQTYYTFVNAQDGQQYRAVLNTATGCPDVYATPVTMTASVGICTSNNCDTRTGSLSVTNSSQAGSGQTARLVAVDVNGIIQGVSSSNTLASLPPGDYRVYQVIFDNTQAPILTAGTAVSAVGGGCVRWSNGLYFKVCSPAPTVGISSPAPGATVATLTPTITGTATPGSTVIVTGGPGSTGGPVSVTADSNGLWSTTAMTFSNGPNAITAIASTSSGGSSTPVSTSFTTVGPPSLTVTPGQPGPLTQPITGTATPGALIAITSPTGQTLCSTTASQSGTFSCPVSLTNGVNNLTVTACNTSGCTNQPISRTALPAPTIAVDPVPATATLTPTITGTATPGSIIDIVGPNSTTLCSTTASQTGSYSCAVIVAPGPQTLTAVATNPGGTGTATTNSFTAVGAPALAVDPGQPGPLTQPVTGTATPGSLVSITDPAGNTLCQTTASASGTFSCPVNLTSGVNNLTVTACNVSGCLAQPISRTALAVPTLVIDPVRPTGPITGTTTPGGQIVITDPMGNTLCTTTASQSGTFSCPVTLPPSMTSVVITACNTSTCTSQTAGVAPTLVVASPVPGPTTQPITGAATPGTIITITGPGPTTLCTTTATASGTFSCPVTVPAGPTPVTVTGCNTAGCSTSVLTVTAVIPPTITVNPLPATSPLTPIVSGTATPGSRVDIVGPNNTTLCSTTATGTGSYSCVVNLTPGPQTLTAVATNPGGTGTATTNSFTASGPANLTVALPTPGPTTQPVTGTATPGSQVVITDPTGNTLCATTASASGTFSCPVNLTSPVTNLTVTACSSAGCTTRPITLSVANAPVVTPDIANTSPDTPVSGNVLTNDRDPQGFPLSASLTTPPTVGTVTMGPDGSYTYTPPTGFTGTTQFCYVVANSASRSSSACVTVNVNPAPSMATNDRPVANDDNTRTTSGSPVTVPVLANDTDPDGSTGAQGQFANPTLLAQPTAGTAVVNQNGTITYTPPVGFVGPVRIPYQVCDNASPALCSTATMNVNVQPTVPAGTTARPVAVDDALLTSRNTSGTGTVATNDYDPNSPAQPLTYTSGQPQYGSVMMQPNGSYTYTPVSDFAGPDSFTYQTCNTSGLCERATVSVLVQRAANQSPTINPDFVDVVPGVPAKGNVLTNDHDPEGDPLTASLMGTPPPGLTMAPDGSYTYTAPASATAPVTIPVQVCDNATPPACSTTTLTLVLVPPTQPGNNAPVINPDAPRTTTGKPLTVNVVANDVDPDGNSLGQPVLVSGPANGTAVVNPDGTISYTPTPGYTGPDRLVYRVCDTGTPPQCGTAAVNLSVDPTPPTGVTNTAPVAIDDALLTTPGIPVTGTVAANDRDQPGQSLTYTRLSGPTNGTVVFSPTGSYTYTPALGYVGSDALVYQVCDNASPALCSTATAYLTVMNPGNPILAVEPPVNPGPPTQPVVGTATPGTKVTIVGPGPTTLCETTASVSGTFSCPISLTSPVTTVTVTACNAVSCTSRTLSYSVAPSVAIVSPTANGSATTTPLISGTATPGSVVTITGGPGSTGGPVSVTAGPNGQWVVTSLTFTTGPQSITAQTRNPGGTSVPVITSFSASPAFSGIAQLTVRVLLQGALLNAGSSGLMRDDLRTGGYLPLTTPYSVSASPRFGQTGGGGGETTTAAVLNANAGTANAIVDWVLVELRSASNPALIVATRSGLLQRDGDVVLSSDGTSPLTFTGLTGTQYYVSLKHRNHLGVMTATAQTLSPTGTLVDFTTLTNAQVYNKPGTVNYDGIEMITVNGKRALWAGDANHDGKVKYIGGSSDTSPILNDVITFQGAIPNSSYNYDFAFGYFFGDLNLNGKAKYQGSVNDPTVIFDNVVATYPLNTQQLYNYDFMEEQLP